MNMQEIWEASPDYIEIEEYVRRNEFRSVFLVCDKAFSCLRVGNYLKRLSERVGIDIIKFDGFHPNPDYESVVQGVHIFRKNNCDALFAVGGGSAIDVAKCVKLFSKMEGNGLDGSFLKQTPVKNDVKIFAIPTTAGTGSEATRYAVVYYNGEKQSITDESIVPDAVVFDKDAIKTLPLYQKKATMLDALCHSVESFWSIHSTNESKEYSKEAIRIIFENLDGYLNNEDVSNAQMQRAAYIAGKAINIAQTTAGHAMCYKLTSLYGIAHGHAAALCVRELWPWMIKNIDNCVDPRGQGYLSGVFKELARYLDCKTTTEAAERFRALIDNLKFDQIKIREKDFEILAQSVNTVRLKNHPVKLDANDIDRLYHGI